MTDRERIEEPEKRVRELEARPAMPTVIVLPAQPAPPAAPWVQPYYPPFQPWGVPWVTYTDGHTVICTS